MTFSKTVELIESWGSDCVGRFGGTYDDGIRLQQSPEEMANLVMFLQNEDLKDINFLEIGCAAGGFTYVMNYFLDIKNNILIDDNQHRRYKMLKGILKDIQYNKWVGDSQSKQAREFVLNLNLKFDIIFIDADHSYKGVKKDTLNYIPFLKKKRFIIFHDSNDKHTEVGKWLKEVKKDKILNLKNVANFVQNKNRLGIGVYQR